MIKNILILLTLFFVLASTRCSSYKSIKQGDTDISIGKAKKHETPNEVHHEK